MICCSQQNIKSQYVIGSMVRPLYLAISIQLSTLLKNHLAII